VWERTQKASIPISESRWSGTSAQNSVCDSYPSARRPDEDRPCRFRIAGEIDETILSKNPEDYFGFWGLIYDEARTVRVYDVASQLLLDEDFHTLERHWDELERRFKARKARKIEAVEQR